MARFMDVHTGMNGIDQSELEAAHRADLAVESGEGVHFLHSWGDAATGTVFCLSEAPDREAVLRAHEKAGHPATEIYELSLEVE